MAEDFLDSHRHSVNNLYFKEKGDVNHTLPEVCKSYVAFSPQQQQQVEPVEQVLLMLQHCLTVGLFHLYQTKTKHCN